MSEPPPLPSHFSLAVNFTLSKRDYLRFVRLALRKLRFGLYFFGVFIGLVFVLCAAFGNPGEPIPYVWLILSLVVLALPQYVIWAASRKFKSDPILSAPQTMTFEDDGFRGSGNGIETQKKYRVISKVRMSSGLLMLYTHQNAAHLVPVAAVPPDALPRLLSHLCSRIPDHKGITGPITS